MEHTQPANITIWWTEWVNTGYTYLSPSHCCQFTADQNCFNQQDNVQRTRSLSNANALQVQDISIQIYMATTLSPWPFRFTLRLRSRDHLILQVPFAIGASLYPSLYLKGHKHIGVTTLTFLCHVTSSVTWPIDSPFVITYWWYIGNEALALTVFEIVASKYIWVTILTFQGHVTSPVTWPFDIPWCHFL